MRKIVFAVLMVALSPVALYALGWFWAFAVGFEPDAEFINGMRAASMVIGLPVALGIVLVKNEWMPPA